VLENKALSSWPSPKKLRAEGHLAIWKTLRLGFPSTDVEEGAMETLLSK
jgi:hypothetical protein